MTATAVLTLTLGAAVTPVELAPGAEAVLSGALRCSHDGATIEADSTVSGAGERVAGGLYDLRAGGWHVVARDLPRHAVRLSWDGRPAPACTAAGLPSPCLPSRLMALAHERLLSVAELVAVLHGGAPVLEVPRRTELAAAVVDDPFPLAGAFVGLSLLCGVGAAGVVFFRRRSADSRWVVRRLVARVRGRLLRADPAIRPLAAELETLARGCSDLELVRAQAERLERMLDELDARRRQGIDRALNAELEAELRAVAEAVVEAERLT